MALNTTILDSDSGFQAKVTKFGQLVTSPLQYSTPVAKDLDVINTAFNFIEPKQDQSIVITDIIAFADRTVSNTTPADVMVYQADSVTSLTADPEILSPQLLRGANFPGIGFNLIIPEGKFVNAKTDDASIKLTIMFYRVPAEDV